MRLRQTDRATTTTSLSSLALPFLLCHLTSFVVGKQTAAMAKAAMAKAATQWFSFLSFRRRRRSRSRNALLTPLSPLSPAPFRDFPQPPICHVRKLAERQTNGHTPY